MSWCRHVRGDMMFFAGLRSMAWVVRRPVMQRWAQVGTTWLRAVWTILLVVFTRWLVVRSGVVLARLLAAHSVHLRLQHTPSILPVIGHLDSIRRLTKGNLFFGRGCRQRSLVAASSQIQWQSLEEHEQLNFSRSTWMTIHFGPCLLCHCGAQQPCHADILISAYSRSFPDAFDRNDVLTSPPPTSDQLSYLAEVREEHDSSEVQRPTKDRYHLGQDGQVRVSRCKSASVTRFVVSATVFGFAGSRAAVEEELPTVRQLESGCDARQKVLRCLRYCKTLDGVGAGASQRVPFPERGGE